jgi:hypothetical protein
MDHTYSCDISPVHCVRQNIDLCPQTSGHLVLNPIARQDEILRKHWCILEQYRRHYAGLRSNEDMQRQSSPHKKGWLLRVSHNRLFYFVSALTYIPNSIIVRLRMTLSSCDARDVRWHATTQKLKQYQRDSWKSHHGFSCKFSKAAVGECFRYFTARGFTDH